MRSLFGFTAMPPHIAGVISAAHELRPADRADRTGIRQLATAYHLGSVPARTPPSNTAAWEVAWVVVRQRQLHATLTGHTGEVRAVAALPLPDGRTLLATASNDRSVRLWDAVSRTYERRIQLKSPCHSICDLGRGRIAVRMADGVVVLDVHATPTP